MDSATTRERLFEVFADPAIDTDTKIEEALETGREQLDLSVGFFTEIDEDRQLIRRVSGDHSAIEPGETCPLEEAYCRRTVERKTSLAIVNARDSAMIPESALRRFDLGTYIGARVTVDGETYGTVCFADHDERDEPFDPRERHFVELLANLCGSGLERRTYERKLNEREEVYRAVIESSFDLVFRIDGDRKFTFVSNAIEDLLGYTPEECVGEPFTMLLPDPETIELGSELYRRVLSGHTVEEEYFALEGKAGETAFVDLRVTPLYQGGVSGVDRRSQEVIGLQGVAREATDRLRRERLIRVLNRVLRHNIRNDLNIIQGYARLLGTENPRTDARSVDRIVRTTERLLDLTESARRLEENVHSLPELAEVEVTKMVRRTANRIDHLYPQATVEVNAPDAAFADGAPRFETALWEVLENAVKHGGDAPIVVVTVRRTDDETIVRVEDDGPGLPDIERDVLETGEETPIAHGKGLGLWLVYWIVQTLNAELRVPDTDLGTCIEIGLPATGQATER